jgi:hypothetical protein
MSGVSPDLPGAVTFAPGSRGGGIAYRCIGPTRFDSADAPTGPGTPTGARLPVRRGKGGVKTRCRR